MIPISILDLVPVIVGETPREALRKSLDLAQVTQTNDKRYSVGQLRIHSWDRDLPLKLRIRPARC
jgi:hypothetical protein